MRGSGFPCGFSTSQRSEATTFSELTTKTAIIPAAFKCLGTGGADPEEGICNDLLLSRYIMENRPAQQHPKLLDAFCFCSSQAPR